MSKIEVPDLALSCWIIEAARSNVLNERGHTESGVRAARRARILAGACAAEGVKILPRVAGEHAEWMGRVAGSNAETGALGRVFLQRLGMYVDAHMRDHLAQADHTQLVKMSAEDLNEVNESLSTRGLPEIPEDDWPPPCETALQGRQPAIRFGILADPHIEQVHNPFVEEAIGRLQSADVLFTVVPGDVTKNGEPESYEKAAALLAGASSPVFCTLGNHDMALSASDLPEAQGTAPGARRFEEIFGGKPYGVYEFEGVRVILLDSAVRALSPFPPFDILGGDFTNAPAEPVPWGAFSDEVTDWMSTLGPSPAPTFVFSHHPPYPYPGFPPLAFGLGKEGTEKLASLVEATEAQAVFCGHTHRSSHRVFEGIPLIEVPSARHWPFAIGLVEVGPGGSADESWWSFRLCSVPDAPRRAGDHAAYIFRRYAAGDKTGHFFAGQF